MRSALYRLHAIVPGERSRQFTRGNFIVSSQSQQPDAMKLKYEPDMTVSTGHILSPVQSEIKP